MTGFDDVMREGFDAHVRAIAEAGGVPRKRARSAVSAIRRRRALRAGTATGASALAVGGIVVGAIGVRSSGDPATAGYPTDSAGRPTWCDLATYPPVNTAALGAATYDGRIYVDSDNDVVVYVAPDGTRRTLDADSDGMYTVTVPDGTTYRVASREEWGPRTAWDLAGSGEVSGRDYGGDTPPRLLYAWTTTVPDTIPVGVDVAILSKYLLASIGFSAGPSSYSTSMPGTVETIFRWTDGRERVTEVNSMGPTGFLEDLTGIESVSVRVRDLPGGGTFEITSTYDPTQSWSAACGASAPSPTTTQDPVSASYFTGQESTIFRCLAPLPEDAMDAIPTVVTVETGKRTIGSNPQPADFGPRGLLVRTSEPNVLVTVDEPPFTPGWNGSWTISFPDNTKMGAVSYTAVAWVDANGDIVGWVGPELPDPDGLARVSGDIGDQGNLDGGRRSVTYSRGYLDARSVPCDGVDASTLAAASLVWIEGYGPDPEHMTWSWTRVDPATN